jgi:predicted RND superfamily exporter protein
LDPIRRPWLTVALCLGLTIACVIGAQWLGFTRDSRVFFAEDNAERVAFEALEQDFSPIENALVAVSAKDGESRALTAEGFAALAALAQGARALPYFDSVHSPASYPVARLVASDLIVSSLAPWEEAPTDTEARAAARAAMAEPALIGRLVSHDGLVAAVSINFRLPAGDDIAVKHAVGELHTLIANVAAAHPDLRFDATGPVLGGAAFGEATETDLRTVMPITAALVIALLLVLLRSVTATFATLAVVAASAGCAMGVAGWIGFQLNPASAGAPPIIMTLAIADSVHLLTGVRQAQGRGLAKRAAIAASLRANFWPIFLTSVTTIIGFLSMNASAAPPLRDLGNIAAVGVAAALFFSLTLLPALLAMLPLAERQHAPPEQAVLRAIGEVITRRRWIAFLLCLSSGVVLAAGMTRIDLDDRFAEYFDERFAFRQQTDFVRDNLTGLDVLEHALAAPAPGAITSDTYLATLDAFAEWYRARPGVVHVLALCDLVRRLNQAHGGEDALPEAPGQASEYLNAFRGALPDGADLTDLVNANFSKTRLSVTVSGLSSAEIRALAIDADIWLRINAPATFAAPATGLSVMYAHVSRRSIEGMLGSSALALVLISGILILTLRSFRLGLISLLPNLAPAAISLGIWGWLVGNLGIASSVVTAMTLGIVVDNTIHFLSKYQRARNQDGMAPTEALRHTFETVGGALTITALVLVAGFAALAASGFAVTASLGKLTALTLAVALVVDLLLLPALLSATEPRESTARRRDRLE